MEQVWAVAVGEVVGRQQKYHKKINTEKKERNRPDPGLMLSKTAAA